MQCVGEYILLMTWKLQGEIFKIIKNKPSVNYFCS